MVLHMIASGGSEAKKALLVLTMWMIALLALLVKRGQMCSRSILFDDYHRELNKHRSHGDTSPASLYVLPDIRDHLKLYTIINFDLICWHYGRVVKAIDLN